MKTYYDILGLDKKCTERDVKKAYRRLVKKFHPDVNKDGAKVFEEITQAYNTLFNPDKRKNYDNILTSKKDAKGIVMFKFREFKDWLFSLVFIKKLLLGKKVMKRQNRINEGVTNMSSGELLKRIIYSSNKYVQILSVRAIIGKGESAVYGDLLRLLYSGIDEDVKIEIIEGLKDIEDYKIKRVFGDIYNIETSAKVKRLLRSLITSNKYRVLNPLTF